MRAHDEIGLVEATYELSADDSTWASQLCLRLTSNLGSDLGAVVSRFTPMAGSGKTLVAQRLFSNVDEPLTNLLRETTQAFSGLNVPELGWSNRLFRLQEAFPRDHWFRREFEPRFKRLGVLESLSFVPFTTPSSGATFSVFSSRKSRLTQAIRNRYGKLSPHLSAAMRLRWGGDRGSLPETRVDAVFEPSGACVHLTRGAPEASVIGRLSAAVRARESARGPMRRKDPDEALNLWSALVCGRWSLVDRLESDGRRFVLAVRNAEGVTDPRALTERQMQVVGLAGKGATNGEIAYALDLTEGAVSAHLHAACRKLKCTGRRDLIRVVSRTEALVFDLDGVTVGVLAEVDCRQMQVDGLTLAERAVLDALRGGFSDAEISALRGVSRNTVAKQVASILRKTGRHSRFELMLE